MKTAFDGASQGLRLEQKGLLSGGSDRLALRELKLLRNRSHHLCRNNPAAITAKNRLAAHWIGTGIKVRWNNKKMQKLWDAFAASPSVDGWGDLYNLQNLWASGYFESGEIFSRMMILERKDMKIPLQLQTLEAEQLDPAYFQFDGIMYGIKFDPLGRPLQYWFFQKNPFDLQVQAILNQRVPVDATDVLHIFQRDRPGQWRGIPKLASVMLPLYEIDELMDATLVRQKVAQAVGWIIKKSSSGAMPLLGNIDTPEAIDTDETQIQKILPGGVHYLNADEEFEFASIDDIGNNLTVFIESQFRLIASALDVTYEQLTGDLTSVNFSSIRAGLIEFKRRVAVTQQLVFINMGLKPLTDRFRELAALYESAEMGNSTCKFVLPKTEWVDPLKDAQADVLEIRAGLATLEEKLAERGIEDFDLHMGQLLKEQHLDVILDSNPVHNTQAKVDVTNTGTEPAPAEPVKKTPAKTAPTKKKVTK
jgi:lambda family phage portal protein